MSETTLEPYATLGVPRRASDRQVREAYRRLARRYHPDLHPDRDSADRMRRINQAWEILSNPARRARYDAESTLTTAGARHWAPVARSSTTFSTARGYQPRRATPVVEDAGPRWPGLVLAVAILAIVVAGAVVGIVPVPLLGIALVVVVRGLVGRFDEGG